MPLGRLTSLVLAACISASCASTAPSAQSVARWADLNRQPSHQLANWSRSHIKAMRHFLRWEDESPEAFRDFVLWTVRNPTKGFEAYVSSHPDGPLVQELAGQHLWSAQAFMDWCHRYPGPAQELVASPPGLDRRPPLPALIVIRRGRAADVRSEGRPSPLCWGGSPSGLLG